MIKALLEIGDLHLRKKDFFEVGFKKFSEWFDNTFPDEARENTEIILAGDVFDKIALLPSVAAMAVELSNLLFKKAKTVYAILGNHDYGLHKYRIENTKGLLEELHFTVIDELSVVTTKLGFKILCLPWIYGSSFKKVNAFIKEHENEEYDVLCSHWELEPMFGNKEDFIDISNLKVKSYACGHIHSHNQNPKYLGSILPNSIAEGKEFNNSVVKMFCKDFESGKSKERQIDIPSFISIKEIQLKNLEELSSLVRDPAVFYKIFFREGITERSIVTQANLLGLNIYSLEKTHDGEQKAEIQKIEVKEYSVVGPWDLIKLYKEPLGITNEEESLCIQIIKSVRSEAA